MNLSKRNFIKVFTLITLFILTNLKQIFAATKKKINQNLSNQQKDIMFNQGTEKAFTSSLLNEKRKGTTIALTAEPYFLILLQRMIAEQGGRLYRSSSRSF